MATTDLLHALETRHPEFKPTDAAWNRVMKVATRRQRYRRLGSALIALALVAGGDAALLSILRSAPARIAPASPAIAPASPPTGEDAGSRSSSPGGRSGQNTSGNAGVRPGNGGGTHWGTSISTGSSSGIRSDEKPSAPSGRTKGGPRPDRSKEPTGCRPHHTGRAHRCRPPGEKWRPHISKGFMARWITNQPARTAVAASRSPTDPASISCGGSAAQIVSVKASGWLLALGAPPRAGPSPSA